jgi:hypothetical protein
VTSGRKVIDRRFACALAIAMIGCGPRQVILNFRTPADCACEGDPNCTATIECPLQFLRSVETSIEVVDGTVPVTGCAEIETPICDWGELQDFVFLDRVLQPSDAVEIRIEGRAEAACIGNLELRCESFGEHTVDLERDTEVQMWCDCPFNARP